MQQQLTRGTKPASVYRLCTIVTFVLVFGLSVCGVFSVYRYTSHDQEDWNVNSVELSPTLKYFDANRDANPILQVTAQATTGKVECTRNNGVDSPWEEQQLGQWRGTEAGCLEGSKVRKGACNAKNVGTNMAALQEVTLSRWRSAEFCVLRSPSVFYQSKMQNKQCGDNGLKDGKWYARCGCHCVQVPGANCDGAGCTGAATDKPTYCPITEWQVTTGRDMAALQREFNKFDGKGRTKTADQFGSNWNAPWDGRANDENYKTLCNYNSASSKTLNLHGYINDCKHTGGCKAQCWQDVGRSGQFHFIKTQRGNAQDTTAFSKGVEVTWYGLPAVNAQKNAREMENCINPNRRVQEPKGQYVLLKDQGTGCGLLGADRDYTDYADELQEWDWYNVDNHDATQTYTNLMNKAVKLSGYQNDLQPPAFRVYLVNRQGIQSNCLSDSCFDFRFNPKASQMLIEYNNIWGSVQNLAVVSASTSVVAVMMLLLVVLEGVRKQTQSFMSTLYGLCLVGLFCSVVLIWKTKYILEDQYTGLHAYFAKAHADQCLPNARWAKVLELWTKHTDFGELPSQLFFLLVLFSVFLVFGVVFAIWALMKLARNHHAVRRRQQPL